MADEIGRSPVGAQQAPDFLTVSQTALVLQLGRSTTYGLVGRFVETSGAEGIPAVLVGGQYRVPRARLEGQRPVVWWESVCDSWWRQVMARMPSPGAVSLSRVG